MIDKELVKMEKFDFLLGNWKLEYTLPKGTGTGEFKRVLDDKYVTFDYSATFPAGHKAAAHGIFAWDEKIKMYRYWWFENSGAFLSATCNFINDETLFMNWHNTLLKQTFKKETPNKVLLRMEQPNSKGEYQLILDVLFTRK